jgi:hypothetical protein
MTEPEKPDTVVSLSGHPILLTLRSCTDALSRSSRRSPECSPASASGAASTRTCSGAGSLWGLSSSARSCSAARWRGPSARTQTGEALATKRDAPGQTIRLNQSIESTPAATASTAETAIASAVISVSLRSSTNFAFSVP